jgi:hypothetical protein
MSWRTLRLIVRVAGLTPTEPILGFDLHITAGEEDITVQPSVSALRACPGRLEHARKDS